MNSWKNNFNKKKPSQRKVLYNTKEKRFVTEEEYEALQKLHDEKQKEIKEAIEQLPNETPIDKEIRESFEEELAKTKILGDMDDEPQAEEENTSQGSGAP